MKEKDFSLLRPFDLEAAKRGEKIHDVFGGAVVFIDGPDAGGKFALRIDGHFASAYGDQLRMAPLCWVEGRPVYKGDVLYARKYNMDGAEKHYVDRLDDDGKKVWQDEKRDDAETGYARIEMLTWTPPKVRREIKLLAFIDGGGALRWVREDYWNDAPYTRIPSEDKVIEVEEPASQEGGAA